MHLTPKQLEILKFVSNYRTEHGVAPSQVEIAQHFGFKSLGTVQNYLVRLERAGAIEKEWNGKRALSVTADGSLIERHQKLKRKLELLPPQPVPAVDALFALAPPTLLLPLLGRVAAGQPIEALEHGESIEVPPSMVSRHGDHFVLRVVGQSMIDDGILDGDLIVVKKQKTAFQNQTVVARLGNEATVKRYYKRSENVIELHPANPAFKTIIVPSIVDFEIEGIVVGVIRKF